MSNFTNQTRPSALVTGASSGIGRAFANRLAQQGYNLVVVGRRGDRLAELASQHPNVDIVPLVADLATVDGVGAVADLFSAQAFDVLVNNAGVAHYMPFATLPAEKASELLSVKVYAPTMLAHAVAAGMVTRGRGTIINVAGMIAFSGAATPAAVPLPRAIYAATLAHIVTLSQALHEELGPLGIAVQVVCPGVVATEFHERQGLDLSRVPRMSADDVVTASLRGLELGEVICAPGVEDAALLTATAAANLAAFSAQSSELATRYRT